ncbi:ABC transporter substrate-binding protein [Acidisphaera sp. L21]|uniref:ABC transporter substrate-binding protein n=1 Tax=Acidisphaera sp. L21 TaxID=1641851 RepID=UPI00131D60BE|nr:ABC transporter substrate-binding protein [Acidisphaera sp. L21]
MIRRLMLAAGFATMSVAAQAGGVITVAMTAGEVPITTGTPDQGFEGYRFVALNLYDALVNWDVSKSDTASDIKPGLATAWHIDPANNKRWLFDLRQGVKWHDGCDFMAQDVVWNFARLMDNKAPQFDTFQFALSRGYLTSIAAVTAVGDHQVAIETKSPDSLVPYELSYVPMISRCRAEALKYDYSGYANQPSGTGPYLFSKLVPHERLELVPNPNYWDKARIPKQDKLVLLPMPEANTRVAALLSGQVNFIEAPAPDAVPRLKSAGMKLFTNIYPHVWAYQLNFVTSPFKDLRVRQAANYAINRDDVKELLGGLMEDAYSTIPPATPYFGHPVLYKFDPKKAHALLEEAKCLPCDVTFVISTSGSGQMQPLQMNELIKAQLEEVGFRVKLDIMDWNALGQVARDGIEKHPDDAAVNASKAVSDPFYGLIRHVAKAQWAPVGSNWGHYEDAETEDLIAKINAEFDPARRNDLLIKLNERMNAQAVMIWVAHDVNPRALSPKLHGFVQAQSWFQDLTPITVDP